MFKKTKSMYYTMGAAMTVGAMFGNIQSADATTTASGSNNFSSIASNINTSMAQFPALISGVAYLFGLLLAVLGVMKIKDHVENPSQTPLKDGAIRLLAGGALFALPIMLEAMSSTLDADGTGVAVSNAALNTVKWNAK